MKRVAYLLLFCFLFNIFLPIVEVFAQVNYTFETGTYHVVWISDNGSTTACDNSSTMNYDNTNIEYIQSFSTYDEALAYMNTLESTDEKIATIIGEKKSKTGAYVDSILNSQYALVDLNTTGTTLTTSNVYTSATNTSAYTYINGSGAFGGVDAALINYNNGTTRSNIKISGITGWVNSLLYLSGTTYTGYDIVPLTVVKSPAYYYVNDNGELVHKLSRKITAENCYVASITLGPAPTSLTATDISGDTIKYYSYDGIYFYTSMEDMIDDYKSDETGKAVNNIPYYNYYMYLPIRTQTEITSSDIEAFLESRGFTTESSSALYGIADLTKNGVTEYTESLTESPAPYSSLEDYMEKNNIDISKSVGDVFTSAQNNYGVNAMISFSTAINESSWGTSALAYANNNLFGHNAYDSSVMTSASYYNTVTDCINRHAYYMMDTLFTETKDVGDRYHGSHLGNKGSGINVKYASDPYWAEKIASYYYSIDNYNDMKDYYKYSIGIKTSFIDAEVKTEASNESDTIYKLKSYYYSVANIPVIILERVVGEEIDGNNIWYKIQLDSLLDEEGNLIQDVTIDDRYDWNNNIGYIHSSYITLMDSSVNKIYTRKTGVFGLENLSLNEDRTINIKGYLGITGMDNNKTKTITYDLVLQDQTNNMTYELPLNRILDLENIPFVVTYDSYDYTYSWFDGTVDLSEVPEGNYTVYIRARSGEYESKEILSNILSNSSITKYTDESGRGYRFRTNYYLKTIPLELFIRDDGLISDSELPTYDNMINQYHEIELKEGKLNISGSSFSIGGNYSTSTAVTRTIIFENTSTYDRYEYNLGYIDNGQYPITLIVSDNLDKTRAWFSSSIDISNLEKGTYAIYIKTKSNIEDYDELNDIFSRDISTTMVSNDKTYSLKINENQRFRVELTVK